MPEKMVKEELPIFEVLLDTAAEQSLEVDFLLPDYEPEVFRLLKTRVQPVIQKMQISGDRLELNGICTVSVLYLGEDADSLQAARQVVPFSKTLELRRAAEPDAVVQCIPRCYFVNARAVSSRRLEVRCGLSLRTKVTAQHSLSVVTKAENGIQLHKTHCCCCGKRTAAVKSCTMSEDLELGQAKPALHRLLDAMYQVTLHEKRLMSGKLILRGDLLTRILYTPEGGGSPEVMEWSEPISQILELPGIEEEHICDIRADQVSGSFELIRNDGGCRTLSAEWTILISAVCDQNEEKELSDDGFSCQFASTPLPVKLPLQRVVTVIQQTVPVNGQLPSGEVEQLLALLPTMGEYSCRAEDGKLIVSGTVELTAICQGANGLFSIDKSILFEAVLDLPETENIICTPLITILSASGTISGEGIEVRLQLSISGAVYQTSVHTLLSDLTIDEEQPLTHSDAALRICYAEPGENLWEIAKRCRTSLSAILSENGLQDETLSERQMLLIPMLQE